MSGVYLMNWRRSAELGYYDDLISQIEPGDPGCRRK
jgi:hypothetical protein